MGINWGNLISGGLGLLDAYNQDQGRSGYGDALKGSIDADYQGQKNLYDYNNQYNQQLAAYNQSQAGAARAAAASRAGAAAATERNRQHAADKAQSYMDKVYSGIQDTYQPYKDTAAKLLPQAANTYSNALGGMNLLQAYLFQPKQLGQLQNDRQAFNFKLPLDKYFAGASK
jgi:hypothetical protein